MSKLKAFEDFFIRQDKETGAITIECDAIQLTSILSIAYEAGKGNAEYQKQYDKLLKNLSDLL